MFTVNGKTEIVTLPVKATSYWDDKWKRKVEGGAARPFHVFWGDVNSWRISEVFSTFGARALQLSLSTAPIFLKMYFSRSISQELFLKMYF